MSRLLTWIPRQPRTIDLADCDLDAVGCFLEFLYTGEYFPRKVAGQRHLETDPSIPEVDENGDQLLKHARVYSLAERFQTPELKILSQSKIHCVNSTAKGELAYARYVYAHTSKEDTAVRDPVTHFWATRSHLLRSEAEDEFRTLCLEFPQFGYDVLSTWPLPYAAPPPPLALLTERSSCPGREAKARTKREDAPTYLQRSQATAPQPRRRLKCAGVSGPCVSRLMW